MILPCLSNVMVDIDRICMLELISTESETCMNILIIKTKDQDHVFLLKHYNYPTKKFHRGSMIKFHKFSRIPVPFSRAVGTQCKEAIGGQDTHNIN